MSAEPIVRVYGVHKYFKRGSEQIDVLNDLSLEVAEGEFLGLMGPSGSGKTTLLNLIAGLDQPGAECDGQPFPIGTEGQRVDVQCCQSWPGLPGSGMASHKRSPRVRFPTGLLRAL